MDDLSLIEEYLRPTKAVVMPKRSAKPENIATYLHPPPIAGLEFSRAPLFDYSPAHLERSIPIRMFDPEAISDDEGRKNMWPAESFDREASDLPPISTNQQTSSSTLANDAINGHKDREVLPAPNTVGTHPASGLTDTETRRLVTKAVLEHQGQYMEPDLLEKLSTYGLEKSTNLRALLHQSIDTARAMAQQMATILMAKGHPTFDLPPVSEQVARLQWLTLGMQERNPASGVDLLMSLEPDKEVQTAVADAGSSLSTMGATGDGVNGGRVDGATVAPVLVDRPAESSSAKSIDGATPVTRPGTDVVEKEHGHRQGVLVDLFQSTEPLDEIDADTWITTDDESFGKLRSKVRLATPAPNNRQVRGATPFNRHWPFTRKKPADREIGDGRRYQHHGYDRKNRVIHPDNINYRPWNQARRNASPHRRPSNRLPDQVSAERRRHGSYRRPPIEFARPFPPPPMFRQYKRNSYNDWR
jgi:hypothetical protein